MKTKTKTPQNTNIRHLSRTYSGRGKGARSTTQVNRELERLGFPERLVQGKGYLYFDEGESSSWFTSSVPVCWVSHQTVEEWVESLRQLRADNGAPPLDSDPVETLLADIARKHLGLSVLQMRGSDSLDFKEVSRRSVRDALAAAYAAGRSSKR